MARLLFLLLIGIALGYALGFQDAKMHDDNVVTRLVERAGGSTRARVSSDVDSKMLDAEK